MNASIMQDLDSPESLIVKTFATMTPPDEAFDLDGHWTHVYDDATSFKAGWSQGGVAVEHSPDRRLRIVSFRNCPQGYKYWMLADLQCSDDAWCTPVSWSVESKIAKMAKDSAYLKSGITMHAAVRDGVLTLTKGSARRILELPGAYTCKGCLLDAVGRMARQGLKEMSFTMLDEYDEPCPEQKIVFCEQRKIGTRTGSVDIISYRHTGIATVPGVFYVDTAGRVLAYLGDMQLLILQSTENSPRTTP